MSGTDKLKNKAQELGGRGKEAAGDADRRQGPAGRGPEGPDRRQPQAGRREGQGRLQVTGRGPRGRAADAGAPSPHAGAALRRSGGRAGGARGRGAGWLPMTSSARRRLRPRWIAPPSTPPTAAVAAALAAGARYADARLVDRAPRAPDRPRRRPAVGRPEHLGRPRRPRPGRLLLGVRRPRRPLGRRRRPPHRGAGRRDRAGLRHRARAAAGAGRRPAGRGAAGPASASRTRSPSRWRRRATCSPG